MKKYSEHGLAENNSNAPGSIKEIWLAGGCFWGVEEFFKRISGVVHTTVGYANGKTENPSYYDIHTTGHAETVHIKYDSKIVSLETLLKYYFQIINPTSVNRQGNDIGTQYRTGIYYNNESDKGIIQSIISDEQSRHKARIATEVQPIENYYLAEDYHQDYLEKTPGGYCHIDFSILKDIPQVRIDPYLYIKPEQADLKKCFRKSSSKSRNKMVLKHLFRMNTGTITNMAYMLT